MPGNHLEELVAEWYQLQGYFVRRNVQVGKRARGGYECELDIVAFHPKEKKLAHIEPSLDSDSWEERERRYTKKFEAGRRHIPALFEGLTLPSDVQQVALFVYGGASRSTLAGGLVMLIKDFMREVLVKLRTRRVNTAAIPEEYPLLRTLQFAAQYWPISELSYPSTMSSSNSPHAHCVCCKNGVPKRGLRVCPICKHVFQGNGWDGVDAHWRANHENDLPYQQFFDTLCPAHRG